MTNAKRRREKRAKVPGPAGEPNELGNREFRRSAEREARAKATVARKQQRAWDSWQKTKPEEKAA